MRSQLPRCLRNVRCALLPDVARLAARGAAFWAFCETSPNQVLTHAARAAAKQLNKRCLFRHLWWPRAARAKGRSGQSNCETSNVKQALAQRKTGST